jgi:hydroxymethylbilane synthase
MKIGTRGSALALWQAQAVARSIADTGGPACDIVIIRTAGDEPGGPPDSPSPSGTSGTLNVKRMFVKEIEDALLDGRVDLAVHSAKDLPAHLPDGLLIGAALAREDPRDTLLLPAGAGGGDLAALRAALGDAPRIGTSSVRRAAALRSLFPQATFTGIRGNVDTRLRKLDAGDCDVLVLAGAGLKRLNLEARISAYLPVETCVPAPGQGIVAVEIASAAAPEVKQMVSRISDADAATALTAERALVQTLGGGCQMPLGALARLDGRAIDVLGMVTSLDGRRVIRATVRGNRGGAAAAGEKLATALLARGAADLLEDARRA